MTDAYEGNGDYSTYTEDDEFTKQRKVCSANAGRGAAHNGDASGGIGLTTAATTTTGDSNHLNEKAHEYIRDCLNEKSRMEHKFPIAERLLDGEIDKVQTTGRIISREQKYADIYREKPLRVSQKVLVPIREHPKFNFVGKLLGPKGNSLRRLQEETLCKMTVLGRNSMRDRVKEEELRNSKDPKYAHLNSDLHVEISTVAPPAEAYARIAYAMAELRKYLIPDSNDIIRQEQLRELMDNAYISDDKNPSTVYKKMIAHQYSTGMPVGPSLNATTGIPAINATMSSQAKVMTLASGAYNRAPNQQTSNTFTKNNIAPKQKVLSILEKARSAMEETYGRGFETDNIGYDQTHTYDAYNYNHPPPPPPPQNAGLPTNPLHSRAGYDNTDYTDVEYTIRDYYQHSPNYGAGGIQTNQNTGSNPNHITNRAHVNR